jgi:PTS system cellobiose-specific IIC component
LAAVNLVISIAMYVPFVSLATRQELKKVKEAEA